MSSEKDLKELTIKALFSSEDKYTIPIYQRNYSWGKPQIEQLVQDIWDYTFAKEKEHKFIKNMQNYFIGNLIVYDRKQEDDTFLYETIDGQQRLTTLTILMNVLKNEFEIKEEYKKILTFYSREISTNTIEHLYRILSKNELRKTQKELNNNMLDAYEFLYKKIDDLQNKIEDVNNFVEYLLSKVIILRISVPEDTDLNHYFEIMNNRGEQLEKHEIVKALLLGNLQIENPTEEEKEIEKAEMQVFKQIWEGCENMERYIQYAFKPKLRSEVFSSKWNKIQVNNFDELVDLEIDLQEKQKTSLKKDIVDATEKPMLLCYVLEKGASLATSKKNKDRPELFSTVINFSNFLLHVLRIQVNEEYSDIDDKDVPLDDKRLLDIFKNVLEKEGDKKAFSKLFIINLLKAKFYFDQFVVKRDNNDDSWSLLSLSTTKDAKAKYTNTFQDLDENKHIVLLLSMFHVSYPQRLYKHWLNAVLNATMKNEYNGEEFIEFLKGLAKKFLFDRYLNSEKTDYHTLIYKNKKYKNNKLIFENLDEGTKVENFVFNFIDYILWRDYDIDTSSFSFEFRNSVEHHYPQNPINEMDRIDQKYLDNFGNLCLLARKKNSKLNNLLPEGKKDHYRNLSVDSLKQKLMFDYKPPFDIEAIKDHRVFMIELIEEIFNNE